MSDQQTQRASAFLGTGWAFPVDTTAGEISSVSYEEDIKQAIRIILDTNPGERVMRPDFGAGLNAFVFQPVNSSTLHGLRFQVEKSLVKWEPRIDLETVTVVPDKKTPTRVLIDISYRVRLTNTPDNLVYPFYLQEGKTP